MADSIDCREAHARLQDYLKRELTNELEAEMRAHLDRCRPCFTQARFEANFMLMLERLPRRCGCPEGLRARIVSILRLEMERD